MNITFITNFFPKTDIGKGPWGERYNGLYGSIFSGEGRKSHHLEWYDLGRRCLHVQGDEGIRSIPTSLSSFLLVLLIRGVFRRDKASILLSYPCFRGREILGSLLLLITLGIVRFSGKVNICLDYIDPPLMMMNLYAGRSLFHKVKIGLISSRERMFLELSDTIITNAKEMGIFLQSKYRLSGKRIQAIPMGVNVRDFPTESKRDHQSHVFTLVYGGAISEERGIKNLLSCIERINRHRPVKLVCCGRIHPSMIMPQVPWLEVRTDLDYQGYVSLLMARADAGIIPYPVNEWWGKVSISKMATYAVAGIPIITTNLEHTAGFIRKHDCGLVAKSWQEMETLILRLAEDRSLCEQLGGNARTAAESELDWEALSAKLRRILSDSDAQIEEDQPLSHRKGIGE